MIASADLARLFDEQLLRTTACPVCLSALYYSAGERGADRLLCSSCPNVFYAPSGLPVLLVDDEHRRLKADEVRGETEYNVKKIPPEVHQQRNEFVDRNTQVFFEEYGIGLADKEIVVIGGSMAEIEFYARKTRRIVGLDIVPTLVDACRRASIERHVPASWICGDGEYLPLETESFDVVIVRQSLHHMLKYYSAIGEFFRVCRIGGDVLIVDEPFAPLDPQNVAMQGPDTEIVYGDASFGLLREIAGIPVVTLIESNHNVGFASLERERTYIDPDKSDPETWLADKYHNFSLLNCLYALRLHSNDLYLSWPQEVAWTDESGEPVRFCHGPNPHYASPLAHRLVSPGNVSIGSRKSSKTTRLRTRLAAQAMTLEALRSLEATADLWSSY